MGQARHYQNTQNLNPKVRQWIIYAALYTITTLNFMCTSLFSPPINRQLRDLGISHFLLGITSSIYGATNLVSSFLVGVGCDRYGVSLVFILAIMGTCLNNCVQVFTISLPVFVLARSSAGLLKHTATLGKMLLAQFAKRNELAWRLGYIGAFSNLGVVIGPSLGAYFLQFDGGLNMVFILAVGMSAVITLLTAKLLWVSSKLDGDDRKRTETKSGKIRDSYKKTDDRSTLIKAESSAGQGNGKQKPQNLFRSTLRVFLRSERQLLLIFALKFCFNFASHGIRSSFPLIMRKYSASVSEMGYLNSLQSVIAMLVGFMVSPVIYYAYRNDVRRVTIHAGCIQMVSFVCQIISPTFMWTSASYLLLEVSNPFLWVSTTALALQYRSPKGDDDDGSTPNQLSAATILSVGTMLANLSNMLAPLCAGVAASLLTDSRLVDGDDGPALVSACFSIAGVLFALLTVRSGVTSVDKEPERLSEGAGLINQVK